MTRETTPFHAGELEAQRRAGVAPSGRFIRDYMPEQHREFFAELPFIVLATGDAQGRPWVTLLEGAPGFIDTPDSRTLSVAAAPGREDPLATALEEGAEVGLLGIELATRRRNRLNGMVREAQGRLVVAVQQSFGNCPQYIRERAWHRVEPAPAPAATASSRLNADQRARISAADTFFIGSVSGAAAPDSAHNSGREQRTKRGYDASHRGGEPGFVQVTGAGTLRFPDYPGNNFFNTLGNLIQNPRVGLLFVDFETGGLLQISGRARIEWQPEQGEDPSAQRWVEVSIEQVVERPEALALRWQRETPALRLEVLEKRRESDLVTSFLLASADGGALPPFRAGQHLPLELSVPGQPGRVRRSYSLSGSPGDETYRISVKREAHGIASRFLHDRVAAGDCLTAHAPAGDFVLPAGQGPLVLISAGVGITPMLAMLYAAMAEGARGAARDIWFVHATRNGDAHAFRAEVEAAIRASAHSDAHRIERRVFYSATRANDTLGQDYDAEGRLTAADLLALEAGEDAHYLLCGPAGFLADLSAGLEAHGVAADRIAFETFGPAG
ncbi:pyridoxamine 5'-phosphate oxidase family protein [Salinicola sp. DM10]|uniref:pyridoxamine 5'-phosphate oxidase family protein n=1 Tax=Salinicola sp. DM10 TaxID=2815721 RepID=UPI001E57A44B|nr:pyridoxamine 5'-phosphate oxidase family protein [Salinicola sp. DM10]MCE3026671.1 pyridoxamine 5'-phosphate oxidase family protein [Salinicola sp. DM10]